MAACGLACDQDFGFGTMNHFPSIAKANGLNANDHASHFSEIIPVFHQNIDYPRLTAVNVEAVAMNTELTESKGVEKNLA